MRALDAMAGFCLPRCSAWYAVLLAATLTCAPLAAHADDGEDGAPDLPEVCEKPGDPRNAAAVSTADLYDFVPLADLEPAFRPLRDAAAKKQWATVLKLAPELADRARQPLIVQATVLLQAQAHEALRQWTDAERTWKRLAQSGPLAQRARLHLADLALKRKDLDEALVQLAAVAPWHVAREGATLQMARLELDRGNVGPARDALERIKVELLHADQKALFLLLRGEVALRTGRQAEARDLLEQAWRLDVEPYAGKAAKQLANLGAAPTAPDQIERILRRREVKPGQVKGWLHEAEAVTEEGSGLRLYVQGALWIRDKATRERAAEALRKSVELLDDPLLKARALYALGDALGKTSDDKGAIATLDLVPQTLQGQSGVAVDEVQARTLTRLHRLYNNIDRPADATVALQKLLDLHPSAQERELAVWGLGWQKFQGGEFAKALELFVKLEREYGNLWTGAQQPWRAKAIYWQGRSLQQLGQTEAALEAWASVTNTYAQTYYGILSLDRIREIDPDRAARLAGPPPSPAGTDMPAASLDRLRVARSPALDEAALLVRMGLQAEARSLLRDQLALGLPRDGVHLLATLYEVDGRRSLAFGVMSRHTRRAARPDDSTAHVWRQSFPKAFFAEASDAAQGAGLHKALLYAIMRHESAFVPTTVSKAGAYGLVQLLPSSAKHIADLYKVPFAGAGSLLRPGPNLQLGALYLTQLLSFFKGNEQLAAAAYNAGPYAVRDWVKRWHNLPTDALVENIPYPATRAYVMQVTASAQTYAWLYPEWQEIATDQLARSPSLPQGFGPFMTRQPASTALVN